MIRTVAVFVFVSFACVATAFSQTIEKENKIDVQKKNSSAEVSGRQLPEAKNIEPKLPVRFISECHRIPGLDRKR